MKPLIGFVLAWGGYTLLFFGWDSLHNGGHGLVQLAIKQPSLTPTQVVAGGPSSVAGIVAQNPTAIVTPPSQIINNTGSIKAAVGG